MINANELQSAYVELYKCLRGYIWDVEVVELIANVEVECYKSFPDLRKLSSYLKLLKNEVRYKLPEPNEALNSAFDEFDNILDSNSNTDLYASLKTFHEVNIL